MTLEDLGNIGEFVGAIGVVVTLIYLAVQIRQNTKSLRSSTFQEAIRDAARSIDQLSREPGLTRTWFAGLRDFEALNQEERQLFAVYMTAVLRRYENILYQAEHTALSTPNLGRVFVST